MERALRLSDYISDALARAEDSPAIQFKGRWLSWGWVKRTAAGVQQALEAAGLADDDPVGFAPKNRPECWRAKRIGASRPYWPAAARRRRACRSVGTER
jgi:hypothetical protein